MRLPIAVLALLAFGFVDASGADAADAAVVAEIKSAKSALDDAFARHDVATIKQMVTADHLAVTSYYGRPFTTADEVGTIADFKAEYFDFTDPVVTVLGPDAAQITFENSYRGTFEGKPLPPRVFVSESWLKQDGKWLQQLYQETPINAK
jgi:Domain of unknown function (DUF4440)